MKGLYALSLLVFSVSSVASAQDYAPLPAQGAQNSRIDDISPETLDNYGLTWVADFQRNKSAEDTSPSNSPWRCANPPALEDLTTKIVSNTMSSSAAVNLGFSIGSVGGSTDRLVLIEDWSRQAPCLAEDGKTTLVYGKAVRVITSLQSLEARTQLTFPIIAAEATLNNRATSVFAELVAINDTPSQLLAASLLGPLTVENFGAKNQVVQDIVKRVTVNNDSAVALIGVKREDLELRTQVASAFAVQQIEKGRSCLAAKGRIESADTTVTAAIEGVYLSIVRSCGVEKPTPAMRAQAESDLLGLEIRD